MTEVSVILSAMKVVLPNCSSQETVNLGALGRMAPSFSPCYLAKGNIAEHTVLLLHTLRTNVGAVDISLDS